MKSAEAKQVGRPTKKTPELVDALCTQIEAGLSFKSASYLVGINPDTFWTWVKEDPAFSDKVKTARAKAVARWVTALEAGGLGWQSKAWLLERLEFDDWGAKQRIEHTGKDGEKLSLVWPWEVAVNGTNGSSPGATSHAGNGSSLPSEIPGSRVRAALGQNGS